MTGIKKIILNDGNYIPLLGLGVNDANEKTYDAVSYAFENGYRHIDTAEYYNNESDVGAAINDSKLDRKEIFVTTKIHSGDRSYKDTIKIFENSLNKMNLDYIDLYLIHWPLKNHEVNLETWSALEDIKTKKLSKSIGVSNFAPMHLDPLIKKCNILPVVNQIEKNPFLQQKNITSFCKEKNIHVTCYCPIARAKKFDNTIIKGVATETKRTISQVMLKWLIEQNHSVIPKSTNQFRIKENADIFDFTLNNDSINRLNALENNFRICADPNNHFTF